MEEVALAPALGEVEERRHHGENQEALVKELQRPLGHPAWKKKGSPFESRERGSHTNKSQTTLRFKWNWYG